MPSTIARPAPGEYPEFHRANLAAIADEPDAVAVLEGQRRHIERLRGLTARQAGHRYAAGKWNVREMIGHLSDTERILSYRLLRIARGDRTPLAGFDESAYAARSNAARRPLPELVDELAVVRQATLALVRSLDEADLAEHGVVRDWQLSVRALAFIIGGHFQHHVNVLRDRYDLVV
jgi:hypothetical protein